MYIFSEEERDICMTYIACLSEMAKYRYPIYQYHGTHAKLARPAFCHLYKSLGGRALADAFLNNHGLIWHRRIYFFGPSEELLSCFSIPVDINRCNYTWISISYSL